MTQVSALEKDAALVKTMLSDLTPEQQRILYLLMQGVKLGYESGLKQTQKASKEKPA